MKAANNISIRVFCKEDEDRSKIIEKLKLLLPFDLDKEKTELIEEKTESFNDRRIYVIKVVLRKERHINAFIENLVKKLGEEKKTLIEQMDSRLDEDLNFFIRLDKEMLLKGKYILTDSGNCYHIRIGVAVFPKKRDKGIEAVSKMFNPNQK